MSTLRVFVYGTLRSGASNSFRMEGALLLGSATVAGQLYRVDWYPGIKLIAPNECSLSTGVVGEVYEVDRALLQKLDAYEGSEYRRIKCAATLDATGEDIEVFIWEYIDTVAAESHIPSGDWLKQ